MRGPGRLVGILAALTLISASPTPPAGAAPVPDGEAKPEPAVAEASQAAEPPAVPGLRIIAPTPDAVAQWCNAEQQGAHVLAEQLRRKERELDEAARSVALREAEIKSAEAGLDTRLAELQKLRDQIDGLLQKSDEATEKHVADLVKMVEANRASAAAPILAALDPDLAVRVLERMNTQKAGKLLAELPPATAAALATRFTKPIAVEAP